VVLSRRTELSAGRCTKWRSLRLSLALAFALPEYQDKFRMSLDSHFVGTFGAAQRARHIVQNPKFLSPSDPGYVLESDRYIGDKSIYWRLTICRMTRYRRVKYKKGEEGI
jgi:hypothetical protein